VELGFTKEELELKDEVREYFVRLVEEVEGSKEKESTYTHYIRRMGEDGWLGLGWPKEYGGQARGPIDQMIFVEESHWAGVPLPLLTLNSVGPTLMALGTDEQKKRILPGILKGKVHFSIGYSEPSAGTDLASLKTRAVRDGDEYVINGQKMYTSAAHMATHIYLMARTNPNLPKHRGISIFLFPMDTPGITVRPLWTIQNDPPAPIGTTYGTPRTNETFFDDVRIPASCMLGKENEGWRVGAMGLNLDRVGAARYLISVRRDEDIVNFVKSNKFDGYSPASDPAIRDKIAELWIEAQVCRLMTMRSMSIVEHGGNFTYEGSAEKVWAPEHGVRTTEAISQMLGPYGQLLNGSPHAVERGVFAHNLMGAFQSGINHGSTQVMRDQVARRGLDMPRK